ncbi:MULTISPECIES: bifunctional DNA primase/polymerase [Streptomyces]|uniref:bifunctional DNA primase/polymerase n=1 Tax=Streptomyces TaxID=1883 RepID=UPI0004AB7F78|nr:MULTISPECIES: bifunctional DNA primase/polymerase [Streptomyces]
MESTGLHWLAQVAPDPEAFREQWERTPLGLMLLPAGRRWDVLSVPGRLGRPALEILGTGSRGPVLTDFGEGHVSFLVPVGTAARWVGTGVRGAGEGTWIVVPHPERSSRGVRWLVPPDGSGRLNDPVLLELALHEAAAGLSGW